MLGTGQRDTKPGSTQTRCVWDGVLLGTGDGDGRPGDTQDRLHLQPVGDRVGRGAQDLGVLRGDSPGSGSRSSPGTCVSGGRQRTVPHPARYSSPCLARAGPQPIRDLPHPSDPTVPVSPAHPALPTGTGGGPAGLGGTAVGTRSLTLQLVADAVGHFLDLRRQLLQVVFGLCGVTAREPGKPPRGTSPGKGDP